MNRNRFDNVRKVKKINKDNKNKFNKNGNKNLKQKNKDKDDLDKEMRQYWVKSGSAKGKVEEKNLAAKKMNE